jgi:outer membrane protein assembly factor BamB
MPTDPTFPFKLHNIGGFKIMRNNAYQWTGFLVIFTLLLAWSFAGNILNAEDAGWHQWRGVNRDGISHESGILTDWPKNGLKQLWRMPVGTAYSAISVSDGRLYTMEAEDEKEFTICLDAADGREVWRFQTDEQFFNDRGDGPRSTPTVDGDRVYVFGARGKLYALNAKTGEKIWGHDFVKDFGSGIPGWGFSASPLVEGDTLLIGGGKWIAGFNKVNGKELWKIQAGEAHYSSPIGITFNGKRQMVFLTADRIISVSPKDGAIHWEFPWPEGINIATPVFVEPDLIFVSCSYDKGSLTVRMIPDGDKTKVKEVWRSKVMKNHFNSSVLLGGYLYGFDNAILKCIKADTGEEQWKHRFSKGSLLRVGKHLIMLGERGKLALVEANPKEYIEKANYQLFDALCWTPPTLADGKLYLRTQSEMVCLAVGGERPNVGGAWIGTWGVSGAPKEHQARLDCRVVELEGGQWQATFEGECGRPYKYTIEMLGRQAGDVVLFKGSADLGEQDGGVYDWIGRATGEKFVGFYSSRKYTGTFEMSRSMD